MSFFFGGVCVVSNGAKLGGNQRTRSGVCTCCQLLFLCVGLVVCGSCAAVTAAAAAVVDRSNELLGYQI